MNLFLAVTLYDMRIHGQCAEAILKNCVTLMKAGHTVTPCFHKDLYIDRSRNLCVKMFMETDCSDIIFIDSDLSFDDDAILKLIKYDKDIVAGAYRHKHDEISYPVIVDFSREGNCKDEETGLVYVKHAPTGLMRIQRRVFDKMADHYKMQRDQGGAYAFFNTGMIFPDDNNWYGEDVAFCKKWVEMGGEVLVEPNITFTHTGPRDFVGNFHEYLMGRKTEL